MNVNIFLHKLKKFLEYNVGMLIKPKSTINNIVSENLNFEYPLIYSTFSYFISVAISVIYIIFLIGRTNSIKNMLTFEFYVIYLRTTLFMYILCLILLAIISWFLYLELKLKKQEITFNKLYQILISFSCLLFIFIIIGSFSSSNLILFFLIYLLPHYEVSDFSIFVNAIPFILTFLACFLWVILMPILIIENILSISIFEKILIGLQSSFLFLGIYFFTSIVLILMLKKIII